MAANKEKKVKIRLFKDGNKYKDDVTVGHNGVLYKIQRGVDVEVPEGVADILANTAHQEQVAAELVMKLVEATEK